MGRFITNIRIAWFGIVLLVPFVFPVSAAPVEGLAEEQETSCLENVYRAVSPPAPAYAPVAVVMDFETGTVLYQRNGDEPRVPASLTKLISVYTALEASRDGGFPLDEALPVDPRSYHYVMAPGSSLMFLGPDQHVSGWDLLRGLVVSSGNDAAVETALRVSGSVGGFAAEMNRIVRSLGMRTMFFEEPAGLSPGNRVTAREMARFTRVLLKEWPETVDSLFTLPYFAYPEAHHYSRHVLQGGTILQHNRNLLLEHYPGADGLKTGYTSAAGYNLVASAVRDGRRLIVVILGVDAPNHLQGGRRRTEDAVALFDWGFETFQTITPDTPDPGVLPVKGGRERTARLTVDSAPSLVLPRAALSSLRGEIDVPDFLWAPQEAGDQVGTIRYYHDQCLLAEVPIRLETTMEQGGLLRRLWDRFIVWWGSVTFFAV